MPSPECQMARQPEQVRRQRTVGNSTGEFATLALPRVTSSGGDSKAANQGKQSDCDRCTRFAREMLATRRQWREQPNAFQAPRRSMVESGEMTNCLQPPIMLLAGSGFAASAG